ncbi:DUF885 domain-containing protein [Ferrimonas gelatinilytica]|uniref:DUF885 domain-containing protein n=1 Tax=Ferrimonas gelatinilytica TaxID=1255257 RepID=A0ABP9S1H0_9GAMM
MKHLPTTLAIALALGLTGCEPASSTATTAAQPAPASAPVRQQSESDRANALFEEIFMADVMASPMTQTGLGMDSNKDRWDPFTEEHAEQQFKLAQQHLAQLEQIEADKLDEQTALSYRLMKAQLEQQISDYHWRHHSYPINQMYGMQSTTASFLINQHLVATEQDALDYIERLKGIELRFDQLIEQLNIREQKGILAPRFVFGHALSDSRNIVSGAPFTEGKDSVLLADFKAKLDALALDNERKQVLLNQATEALKQQVKRGYDKLIAHLEGLQQRADTRDGVWKLPDGEAFYQMRLARVTTTDLNAKQIHQLGLDEVARIHNEMRQIMQKVGFEGDLQAFFAFMRTDPQFYFSNDESGKQSYLQQADATIATMKSRLDEVFGIKPQADLVVKAVEPFREKSAGKAFYQQPAPDGSRPGIYYANLYNMKHMPSYQMEALAFHEGLPGHHMQIAIAMELESLPKFRRYGSYTAYIEGWGLYSEYLPKEMGFYQDPYSDFGRLAMELWRACRLVVDTGIHDQRWSREQAIDYLAQNTPNPHGDIVKAIERYIVMPGQATAYKVGMLKLLELRAEAKAQMGEQFELKGFHDAVLANGPLPLDVLEQQVNNWTQETLRL